MFTEKTVQGDIRVGFTISKGQLEVEIVCAKGLPLGASAAPPGKFIYLNVNKNVGCNYWRLVIV